MKIKLLYESNLEIVKYHEISINLYKLLVNYNPK